MLTTDRGPLYDVPIFDHGFVQLWQVMGDDTTVAGSARMSLRRGIPGYDGEISEADKGLINRLMRDHHTSPFESVVFQWRIRAPLFAVSQWTRHRFSSQNHESARYVELLDEDFVPDEMRRQRGRAMDYLFETVSPNETEFWRERIIAHLSAGRALYRDMLQAGIAKELARGVLSVSQYTSFIWTVNALGMMNWLHLRNKPTAQAEIRAYAEPMEKIFAQVLPVTHAAFREHWGHGTGMIE